MEGKFIANVSMQINAPVERVWNALTDPAMVRQYLFGTEVSSDWKQGSPVTWKGEWQGRAYEDRGTVLEAVPNKVLETTYWSSMSGLADAPENYKRVRYELSPHNGGTLLKLTQDNNPSEKERGHSEENWKAVLGKMKEILEGKQRA